jgi:Paraquat-inducible protein A
MYANLIAQLVSQVSSHFIIHYHRRIIDVATRRREAERKSCADAETDILPHHDTSRVDFKHKLHEQHFVRPHRGETNKLVTFRWVNKAVCATVLCLTFLVVLGCTLPSFSLEILGIVGVAVESGQAFEEAKTYHSVISVVQLLLEQASFLDTTCDYIGLGVLSFLFLLTVLVVPIVQSLVLAWQWFSQSTMKTKSKISILVEILQAWQYAEVYLLAIFVASWQLGPISEYMVNSYCDSLKDSFAQLVFYGLLNEEDAQCFSVRSSIEGGSYILAAGAVLLALVNSFVTKAVFQFFRDHAESSEDDDVVMVEDIEADSVDRHIKPVPVLFTDTFRWLLRRADRIQAEPRSVLPNFTKEGTTSLHSDGEQDQTLDMNDSLQLVDIELWESSPDCEDSSHPSRSDRVLTVSAMSE